VWRNQALVEPRTLYSLTELSPTLNLGINNADINTLAAALLERMYYCKVKGEFVSPPKVDVRQFQRLNYFRDKVARICGSAAPVSLQQVVEMYSGRKRKIYDNAMKQYIQVGMKSSDAHLYAFVKVEKVDPTKAPRCIQPRKPIYNVRLARYIKPIEHRVYKAIDKVFGDGPTVIKGYNVDRIARIMRGKWKSFSRPVAIGLDAMKFDMHVSDVALAWEHSLYNLIYRSRELLELLHHQIHQKGVGRCKDGKLRYRVRGRRASGDMNTALGNCFIMCSMVHAYAKERNIKIKLMNNGDDCVVFMESHEEAKFLDGLDAWFLEKGFRMTTEKPVYQLPEVEFCQMRPIRYGENNITMVRNIPVALRKDSLITVPVSKERELKAWMSAVGQGGLSLVGGIPIMQNLYRRLTELGCGVQTKVATELQRNSGMHLLSIGVNKEFMKPTPESRLDVMIAWGITPDEQIAFEEYFDKYTVEGYTPTGVDRLTNHNVLFHCLSR